MNATRGRPAARLGELARLFLKLGVLGFGGPAAHVAMMEDEVVRRRGWLDHATFLDLYGATQLIPGPNSTELAIHVGRERAGTAGLLVAGSCFIAPAAAIVTAIAWAYVRFGTIPGVRGLFWGVKPVILAVVAQALVHLGRTALKRPLLVALALVAAGAALCGADEIAVLVLCGGAAAASRSRAAMLAAAPAAAVTATAPAFGLAPLFVVFVKIGSVLFGSGYVLLAFLRAELVVRLHWLSEGQLLDAIAVGQVTPGPVFTTATFVGYLLGGLSGAAVATVAIFLPAFVLVAASGSLLPRLRRSASARAFLDGVNAASLGLMGAVLIQLLRSTIVDLPSAAMALAASALLAFAGVPTTWLVAAGAAIGLAHG